MQSQVYEARLAHARILRRAPDRGTRLIDGMLANPRDPDTGLQVWSGEHGYPAGFLILTVFNNMRSAATRSQPQPDNRNRR